MKPEKLLFPLTPPSNPKILIKPLMFFVISNWNPSKLLPQGPGWGLKTSDPRMELQSAPTSQMVGGALYSFSRMFEARSPIFFRRQRRRKFTLHTLVFTLHFTFRSFFFKKSSNFNPKFFIAPAALQIHPHIP